MPPLPQDTALDASVALLRDGYTFISKRCERMGTDVFATRLLLEPTICMRGADAAELFYDRSRFRRADAAPDRLTSTLFGQGGVQALDGTAHRVRKAMFMDLMTPDEIAALADLTREHWMQALGHWEGMAQAQLFDASMEVLMRAVCAWTGVPLHETEVARRTWEMAAMIDAPGAVGFRHWRGRWARRAAERWVGALVTGVRAGTVAVPADRPLVRIAHHRDADGTPLTTDVAAVEVLNLLRPTVAIGRFIVFAALALHDHAQWHPRLRDGSDADVEHFVHEVRRLTPFFPFAAARVAHDFTWHGRHFSEGTRVLLDLYGTDRDARAWRRPRQFRPERFRGWEPDPYTFIPQGGGDHRHNHRCAGEWITIAVMKTVVELLTRAMDYVVPEQDLRVDLSRIPAIPASRFVISGVRARR